MQAYAWLVKHVERSHQAAAQRCYQVDTLALAARKCGRCAVKREILQTYIEHELYAAVYLYEQTLGCLGLMLRQSERIKELFEFRYGHLNQLVDGLAAHLYVTGLLAQARSVTLGADGLAAVSGQHDAVLDLVLALLQHTEEIVNTGLLPSPFILAAAASVPQVILLLLCKLVIWCEYGEIVLLCVKDKVILPSGHHVTAPAYHGAVINAQCAVGNDQ